MATVDLTRDAPAGRPRTRDVLLGVVLPAIVLAGPRRIVVTAWARSPHATAVLAVGVMAWQTIAIVRHWSTARLLGRANYLDPTGSLGGGTVSGERPMLLGIAWIAVAAFAGACSVTLLVLHVVPSLMDVWGRVRRQGLGASVSVPAMLVVLGGAGYAGSFVMATVLFHTYDRYLLPLIPLATILALHRAPNVGGSASRADSIAAGVAFAGLAVLGGIYVLNAASFDGTKWLVDERALEVARDPRLVSGGAEWIGMHGYFGNFRTRDACILVTSQTSEPVDDADLIAVEAVWGPAGSTTWIVARQVRPC